MIIFLNLSSVAGAETIKLTTYYPAPFGAYDQLRLVPRAALGANCKIGTIYVDSDDNNKLKMCQDTDGGDPTIGQWEVISGAWTQNGNKIFPSDTVSNANLNVGIGTSTPPFKLSIDTNVATPDGGIFAEGTQGSGTILGNIDAGTYMIWYPKKAAFRAGRVSATQWNDTSIGNYSTGLGWNTTASGSLSFAGGYQSTSSGDISFAFGSGSTASAWNSVAMGENANATASGAIALGFNTRADRGNAVALGIGTHANSFAAVAMGYNTFATGCNSTAMGFNSTASGVVSFALGSSAVARRTSSMAFGSSVTSDADYALAMGYNTTASGVYSTAMGFQTSASGTSSTAMGSQTKATNINDFAIGHATEASGSTSTAMGGYTKATASAATAMGQSSVASGQVSTVMGYETTAQPYASLVIGRSNIISGDKVNWIPTDPVFVIGNGANPASPSNALTVLKNGNVGIGIATSAPTHTMDINGLVQLKPQAAGFFPDCQPSNHGVVFANNSGGLCFCSTNDNWYDISGRGLVCP